MLNEVIRLCKNDFSNITKDRRKIMEQCSNTRALDKYLSQQDKDTRENEKYELEFLEILSNLKIYAMKNDKLELLKDVIKEQFNL